MKNTGKISIIVSLAAYLVMVTACSDKFLEDKRDYANMNAFDVYADPVMANGVFGVLYRQMVQMASPMGTANPLMRQREDAGGAPADEAMVMWNLTEEYPIKNTNTRYMPGTQTEIKSADSHFGNQHYWNGPKNGSRYDRVNYRTVYPTVYKLNEIITSIPFGRTRYDNKEFWDGLEGQAIFARAWIYYDAVRFFGGLPYYTTDYDMPSDGNRDLRLSVQKSIDKICVDFEAAAKLLPAKWKTTDEGRFTSVAAWAMISRARLAMASPIFNASWETGTKRWQAALDAGLKAEAEALAAGYGTLSSIDEWDNVFMLPTTAFNSEAIIKIPKSEMVSDGAVHNAWESYIRPGIARNGTQEGWKATEEMLAVFPMADGRPAVSATEINLLPGSPQKDMVILNSVNGYDDTKFYRNRDPRFYRTFAFSGCEWPGTTTQLWLYGYSYSIDNISGNNYYRFTDGSASDNLRKSRAIVWKMSDPTVPIEGEGNSGNDILEYRFAEILLNIAEAYAGLNDLGNCKLYIDKLRSRVGAGPVPAFSDKYEAFRMVLTERRIELAYEGKRPWDIRRWLLYEGGAGLDPTLVGPVNNNYDAEAAWGQGWHLFNGKPDFNGNVRPAYTSSNNTVTKLGLTRIAGTKWITNKVWVYDINNAYPTEAFIKVLPTDISRVPAHPIVTNHPEWMAAVPPIKKNMSASEREAALDKLDEFYNISGMVTMRGEDIPKQYNHAVSTAGTGPSDIGLLFSPRAWYYVFGIKANIMDPVTGNYWLTQNEGWISTLDGGGDQEKDGRFIYCTVEE